MTDHLHLRLTVYGLRLSSRRRAVVLLLTLLVVAAALTMALPFVAGQGTMAGVARNINSGLCARATAETALQLALSEMRHNPHWRDEHPNGVWVGNEPFSGGTFTVTVEDGEDTDGDGTVDGDGDLSDDVHDKATVTATGVCGGVSEGVRTVVTLEMIGNLLMVVPNSGATALHDARRTMLEGWGHVVTYIDEKATQAVFDAAVANSQGIYIPGGLDALGTKLTFAPIGIVAESRVASSMLSDLGLWPSCSFFMSTDMRTTNEDHHIVRSFPRNTVVTIASASTRLYSGTMAPGGIALATRPGSSSIALSAHETGSQLADHASFPEGGIAPARRVVVPWGEDGYDITELNDNGRTVMKRAFEWVLSGGPVATFGDDTMPDPSYYDFNYDGYTFAQRVTLPVDGTLSSISLYINGIPPKPARFALYSDTAGEPDQLLAESDPFPTLVHNFQWVSANMPLLALDAGTYWLAACYEDMMHIKRKDGTTSRLRVKNLTTLHTGFPANWGFSDQALSADVRMFGNYLPDIERGVPTTYIVRNQPD